MTRTQARREWTRLKRAYRNARRNHRGAAVAWAALFAHVNAMLEMELSK